MACPVSARASDRCCEYRSRTLSLVLLSHEGESGMQKIDGKVLRGMGENKFQVW